MLIHCQFSIVRYESPTHSCCTLQQILVVHSPQNRRNSRPHSRLRQKHGCNKFALVARASIDPLFPPSPQGARIAFLTRPLASRDSRTMSRNNASAISASRLGPGASKSSASVIHNIIQTRIRRVQINLAGFSEFLPRPACSLETIEDCGKNVIRRRQSKTTTRYRPHCHDKIGGHL
jgi:hypothetical protein